MPLPGMQPWARLDDAAAAEAAPSGGIVEPGIGMGRQLSAAAAPVRSCPVDVEWGKLAKDPNKGRAAVFTLYNIGECGVVWCGVVQVRPQPTHSVTVIVMLYLIPKASGSLREAR